MDEVSIRKIRSAIKRKILLNEEFVGHENIFDDLLSLLHKTIQYGESNSALLIGPRGSGKTKLVNSIIRQLIEEKAFENDAVLVRLHGLVHTDDRLALRSITGQMQLENAVDGKVFGSFAENLAFLLACLKSGKKETSKSVVFILDEFDLFCSHHNQTLLYNLFDISQSAQAPICVLGITCRLDVIELLEKRVKSRFSHRQIFLFPGEEEKTGTSDLEYGLGRIEYFLKLEDPKKLQIKAATLKQWNKSVDNLITDKKFRTLMQRLFDIDLNETTLKNILMVIVSQLSLDKNKLTFDMFQEQMKHFEQDELVQTLQDLSILELSLLIAMKHHVEIYDNQPMNFEMVLTRYTKFVNANSGVQTAPRPVIMKAFEHIQKLELISPVSAGSVRVQKEYQLFNLLVTPQQILEAVNKSSFIPTEIVQWAISSLA